MKLRIQGNSIRIRLSQVEVQQLGDTGVVSEELHFPNAEKLEYELVVSDNYGADLAGYRMTITLPKDAIGPWIQSKDLSLESALELPDGGQLKLLIEKDLHTH